ncbi:hypothetical protein CPAR01_07380 [Colletotrichum paranaense]|uniref:Uncharacterized protein n=1 Tax=Colletotrichum paranaense TaxID=1914294 RepID=A0ABQ9SPE9_9PEZI|nr:uncharacterized protein CPAR01_07380 [Colletotrichum paranaense]KAK1541391.1 hypothetical protein CPAR01_07380 [Colletotrichum paranaense]
MGSTKPCLFWNYCAAQPRPPSCPHRCVSV